MANLQTFILTTMFALMVAPVVAFYSFMVW